MSHLLKAMYRQTRGPYNFSSWKTALAHYRNSFPKTYVYVSISACVFTVSTTVLFGVLLKVLSFVPFFRHFYLFDLCLEMPQLDALFQMSPVLLCRQVQLLLLLVEELQQVLHSCGHVHISVAQQLHTCPMTFYYPTAAICF